MRLNPEKAENEGDSERAQAGLLLILGKREVPILKKPFALNLSSYKTEISTLDQITGINLPFAF